MSKILITGNGFDLFHHLPTKYQHFISIMQTIEKHQFKDEVTFLKLFGRSFKDRFPKDFESIVENYNVEHIKFDNLKIKQIDELLKENLWYKYFKTVLEIDTWIDFEVEINEVLILVNNYFDYYKSNYNKVKLLDYKDKDILSVFKIISVSTNDLDDKYKIRRKVNERLAYEVLLYNLEDFIKIFNRYLVDIVSAFYDNIKQKISIPYHLMNEIYTFNYTPTLEKMYKVDKSKVVYLHGEINEDFQKQNLVLGISELNDEVKESKIYGFTKYYQKVNKNSNNKFVDVPKRVTSSLNETVFYIIGHSLDLSDKEYIIDLFKFLEFDHNEFSKICVFYFNENDKVNKWNNLFSIIDKEIILEMNKSKRLYFVELSVENIQKEFCKDLYVDGGLVISVI